MYGYITSFFVVLNTKINTNRLTDILAIKFLKQKLSKEQNIFENNIVVVQPVGCYSQNTKGGTTFEDALIWRSPNFVVPVIITFL